MCNIPSPYVNNFLHYPIGQLTCKTLIAATMFLRAYIAWEHHPLVGVICLIVFLVRTRESNAVLVILTGYKCMAYNQPLEVVAFISGVRWGGSRNGMNGRTITLTRTLN
jgi:hypothetical protein